MTVTVHDLGATVTWTRHGHHHTGQLIRVRQPGTREWWDRAGKVDVANPDGYGRFWPAELEVTDEAPCPTSEPSASTANPPAPSAGPPAPQPPLDAATGSAAHAAAAGAHETAQTTAAPPEPREGSTPSASSPDDPEDR